MVLIEYVKQALRLLSILAFMAGPPTLPAQRISSDSVETLIRARIAEVPGATVGVVRWRKALAFGVPRTDGRIEINADSVFHAANTMKLAVMLHYFRRLQVRRIDIDTTIRLRAEFKSMVDALPYTIGPGADFDSSVYERVGQDVPLSWLVERMIVRSSNLAANAVLDVLSTSELQETARDSTRSWLRGGEDTKALLERLTREASPRELASLMMAIASGMKTSWGTDLGAIMFDMLSRHEFNEGIPAGLPPSSRVANKTGWDTGVLHDAAIVYPEGETPYYLVVMTKGIPDRAEARRLIADISRIVSRQPWGAPP